MKKLREAADVLMPIKKHAAYGDEQVLAIDKYNTDLEQFKSEVDAKAAEIDSVLKDIPDVSGSSRIGELMRAFGDDLMDLKIKAISLVKTKQQIDEDKKYTRQQWYRAELKKAGDAMRAREAELEELLKQKVNKPSPEALDKVFESDDEWWKHKNRQTDCSSQLNNLDRLFEDDTMDAEVAAAHGLSTELGL